MTADATPSPSQELEPGSTFGAYRINRLLGRGGMGAVYEAAHETDGRVVALKLLSVDLDKMDSRQRFLREGQTAAAINHPNAVYIYGTEEIAGTPVIAMELVPGGTLEEKVKGRGPLPVAEAVEDILQVIDGLDAALAAGVLHRDVKPANCFVNTSGVVKIGDFGLSKPVDGEEQQKLTRTGVFLGTPVFSSPEQLLGETLDVRSDIYAVGVTFYYLLTGQLPYQSGSMMQVVAAVLNGSPTPLSTYRADLPPDVVDVVMKAIARKTADRYQDYGELRAAVLALRKAETSPATLWDRLRAGFVDLVVTSAIVWLLSLIAIAWSQPKYLSSSPHGLKVNFVLGLVIAVLVMGVPEGLLGASVGKWLVGIRVTGIDGRIPGLTRGLARVAVFQTIDLLGLLAQIVPMNLTLRAWLAFLATFGLRALLLVTVRRANGWMMLQDLLTGTRVLRPQVEAHRRRGTAQQRSAPALSGSEHRVGPYAVVGPVPGEGDVLAGWDASMARAVWIVQRQVGAPEVAQARRDLARLTRLRWVAGRRSADENWDAFEAPAGELLAERVARGVTWDVLRGWVLDLTGELIAAHADGTLPASLTADALWVAPGDRIVVPESGGGAAAGDPLCVVTALIECARPSAGAGGPLPRYATRALAEARAASNVSEVQALFKATLGRPAVISRARRSGLAGGTLAAVLFIPILAIVPIRQQAGADPEGRKLSGLLQFIGDSAHALPDSLRPKAHKPSTGIMDRFNRALQKAGWFTPDTALDRLSPEEYRRERRLAEEYVAATLGTRVRDSAGVSMLAKSPPEQRLAKGILKEFPVVDSADLRAARTLVDSTWRGTVPGTTVDLLLRVVGAVLFVFIPWFVAACAIIMGIAMRRGPLMRGFQLDIVTRDGTPAGRVRILVRNIVIWLPVAAPLVMDLAVESVAPARAAFALDAATAGMVALIAAGIALSIWTPARGPGDRIAGTWLVPE
ncbi:MAG: protein kinase domain-containing protein [Gemmatimonadaceae bacterium]